MPRRRSAAVLVATVLAVAGCNDDGRTLAPAPEVPASPLTTTSTTTTTVGVAERTLSLRSPGLADGAFLDAEFTCDGRDVHPPLVIAGTPPGAAELAISVIDVDAGGRVHWVVTGLPATTGALDAGALPAGAVEARADDGDVGWSGPCPPPGDGPHRYEFTLYATAEPVGLAPDVDGRSAMQLIDAAAIEVDRYTLRYERQP